MARSRVIGLIRAITVAVLALAPAAGHAQTSVYEEAVYAQADPGTDPTSLAATDGPGPTLDCSGIALRLMAAEVGGARFVCKIDGAPAGDSSFTVQAMSTGDDSRALVPLCTGSLVGGVGACVGSFIDRNSSPLVGVSFSATLQPSGSALGPAVSGRPSTPAPLEPTQPILTDP
jgi:hypothetical protein